MKWYYWEYAGARDSHGILYTENPKFPRETCVTTRIAIWKYVTEDYVRSKETRSLAISTLREATEEEISYWKQKLIFQTLAE